MKKFKYKTVSLMTIKGIEEAEQLKENGWKIISNSPFTLIFEKQKL